MLFEDALINAYKDNCYTQDLWYQRLWLGRGGENIPNPIHFPWFHIPTTWLVDFWEKTVNDIFYIAGVVLCSIKASSSYELKLITHEEINYVWTFHSDITLFKFIIVLHGIDDIFQNISHIHIECEECFVDYYQSHIALVWTWMMLWRYQLLSCFNFFYYVRLCFFNTFIP